MRAAPGSPRPPPSGGSTSSTRPSTATTLTGSPACDRGGPVGAGPPAGAADQDHAVGIDRHLGHARPRRSSPRARPWGSRTGTRIIAVMPPSMNSTVPPTTIRSTHHGGSQLRRPAVEEPASRRRAQTVAMTVHTPSPPACTSIGEPEQRDEEQAERPPVDGQVREADERADDAHRADEPGEADRRGVELEHDQREADDDQEVRDRRADEPVQQLAAEVEPAEAHLLVGLATTVAARARSPWRSTARRRRPRW